MKIFTTSTLLVLACLLVLLDAGVEAKKKKKSKEKKDAKKEKKPKEKPEWTKKDVRDYTYVQHTLS